MIPMLALIVVTIVSLVFWAADMFLGYVGWPRPNVNPLSVLVMQGGTYVVALIVFTLKTDDHLSRPDVARGDAPAWMALGARLFGDANSGWLSLPATIVIASAAITAPAIVDEREWLMFWGWTAFLALSLALAGSTFRQGWQINGVPSWELPKEPDDEAPPATEPAKPAEPKRDTLDAAAERIGLEPNPGDGAATSPTADTAPAPSTSVPPAATAAVKPAAAKKPVPPPTPTLMQRLMQRLRPGRAAATTANAARTAAGPVAAVQPTGSLVQRLLARVGLRRGAAAVVPATTTTAPTTTAPGTPASGATSTPPAAADDPALAAALDPDAGAAVSTADPPTTDAAATPLDVVDTSPVLTDPLGAWSEISVSTAALPDPEGAPADHAASSAPIDATATADADQVDALDPNDGSDPVGTSATVAVDADGAAETPDDDAGDNSFVVGADADPDAMAAGSDEPAADGDSSPTDGAGPGDDAATTAVSAPVDPTDDAAFLKQFVFPSAVADPPSTWGNMPPEPATDELWTSADAAPEWDGATLEDDSVSEPPVADTPEPDPALDWGATPLEYDSFADASASDTPEPDATHDGVEPTTRADEQSSPDATDEPLFEIVSPNTNLDPIGGEDMAETETPRSGDDLPSDSPGS